MAHQLIASPYPGGHLVVSPGREGGIKIGVNKYAELQDTASATPVPCWLAAAARAQWDQNVTGFTSAEAVMVRPETSYGYARASYELNLGCNYDCEHCYLGEKVFDGMEWPDRRRLLDIMAEVGVLWLQLTGGEPLVDVLFPETLAYAYGLGMMIQVSSNGSRLHQPRMIELLTAYRPYRVTLSLYGATEESYDAMTRSRGAFKRFIRGLDAARDAGLTMRINCIVSNRNVHERDAMQALASRYGIPAFEYINITPTFHGTGEVLPSQAREVMKTHTPYAGCNAGITHFHADPHGKASICKVGRQEQVDLMAEGAEGLRKLAAVGDRMTTRHGGCTGCTLQKTCGTCMPLATLYRQANAPLETYCQHGSSGPITASSTGGR
jgi:molybdenum cofactor biosynthesis enzyme MoaA